MTDYMTKEQRSPDGPYAVVDRPQLLTATECHRNGDWPNCWRMRCNLGGHCALCQLCNGTKKAMARIQYSDGRTCEMEERPCPL